MLLGAGHAQARRRPHAIRAPAAAGPAASKGNAQEYVDRGQACFNQGRFDQALREFQTADRIYSTPSTELGIARCHEKLGHDLQAADLYRRVADRSPDPFDAEEARSRLGAIEKRRAAAHDVAPANVAPGEAAPAPEAPVADAPPPPRGAHRHRHHGGAHAKTVAVPGAATGAAHVHHDRHRHHGSHRRAIAPPPEAAN